MTLQYMPGFGNDFETEPLEGALPQGRNSPQKCAYGLYAEQLSGSPFTAPRGTNERSWLYRMRPTVRHTRKFSNGDFPFWKTAPCQEDVDLPLNQTRWNPLPMPEEKTNFLEGMRTMTTQAMFIRRSVWQPMSMFATPIWWTTITSIPTPN